MVKGEEKGRKPLSVEGKYKCEEDGKEVWERQREMKRKKKANTIETYTKVRVQTKVFRFHSTSVWHRGK